LPGLVNARDRGFHRFVHFQCFGDRRDAGIGKGPAGDASVGIARQLSDGERGRGKSTNDFLEQVGKNAFVQDANGQLLHKVLEFVVPADVVSHLGNGDSSAGAKQLHSMMDRARMARTGTKKQGKQIKADKFLPT